MLVANVGQGLAIAIVAIGGTGALELAGTVLAGVGGAVVSISYLTLRASIPPDALLGRVGSTARVISLGLQPIGLFVGGLALDAVGGRATLLGVDLDQRGSHVGLTGTSAQQ